MTYYPADGETGKCPADPNGFVRCLKSRTVTPVRTAYGDEPVVREVHTWMDMAENAAHCGDVLNGRAVVMPLSVSTFVYLKESNARATAPWQVVTFSYQGADAKARDFGRLKTRTVSFYGDGVAHPYVTEETLAFTHDDRACRLTRVGTLRTLAHPTDKDYGAISRTTSRVVSSLSGRLLSQTDAAGNTVTRTYDKLGRPKTDTLQPDDPSYRTRTTVDWFAPDGDNRTRVIHTDPLGNRTRTTFDASGLVLTQEAQDVDGPEKAATQWLTLSAHRYNGLGQQVQGRTSDRLRNDSEGGGPDERLPGLTTPLTFTITLMRDGWGQVMSVTGSDGLTQHRETDPVACTVASWTTDRKGKETPSVVQYRDARTGLPVRTSVYTTREDFTHGRAAWSTARQKCGHHPAGRGGYPPEACDVQRGGPAGQYQCV